MLQRIRLGSILIGAVILLGSAGVTKADHWNDRGCRARIRKEERDLDRAERRFGPYSRKAEEERYELQRIRNQCGYYDSRYDRRSYGNRWRY